MCRALHRLFSAVLVASAFLIPGTALAQPAAGSAPPMKWGEARSGLQASVQLDGPAIVGSPLKVHVAVRNDGAVRVRTEGAFAWLLIVQDRETAFFTDKIPLSGRKDWPADLPAGATADLSLDVGATPAYPYQKGLKVTQGYPIAPEGMQAPASTGPLTQVLPLGKLRLRCMVYLARAAEPLMLTSNTLEVTLNAPAGGKAELAANDPAVAALLERFRKDPFAARAAHDETVKSGRNLVPALAQAVLDPTLPDFGRMWLAATLADIRDERAADALIKLAGHPDDTTRYVIAYHGPLMRNAKVDQAILARAQSGDDSLFTAWAARGFALSRRPFPQGLIDAACSSPEPQARAEAAQALVTQTDEASMTRLVALLNDDHEAVRAATARAIAEHDLKSPKLTAALVSALDKPGESARQQMCAALAKLTGQPWRYDPKADPAARQAVVDQWKTWWATQAH